MTRADVLRELAPVLAHLAEVERACARLHAEAEAALADRPPVARLALPPVAAV